MPDSIDSFPSGLKVVEFGQTTQEFIETDDGRIVRTRGGAWIKLHTSFRGRLLRALQGAPLAVFFCIGLHINGSNESFPPVRLIVQETGYSKSQVLRAIRRLENLGLITVRRRHRCPNVYTVQAMMAFGTGSNPVGESRSLGVIHDTQLGVIHDTPSRATKKNHKEQEMDLTYEPCDDMGMPLMGKAPSVPKWSIPEDNPYLKRAMAIARQKRFTRMEQRGQWKIVKAMLAAGTITPAWLEHCLSVQEKRKPPMPFSNLLKWMANSDKMNEWEIASGQPKTTIVGNHSGMQSGEGRLNEDGSAYA